MRAVFISLVIAIVGVVCGWILPQGIREQPRVESDWQTEGSDVSISSEVMEEIPVIIPSLDEICTATGAEGTRLLVRYLEGADLGSIQALIGSLSNTNHWAIQDWGHLICLRAVEVDAPGFWAWLESANLPGLKPRSFRHLRGLALQAWARVDRNAAILACATVNDRIRRSVITDLADGEVDAVLELVREHWKGTLLLTELESRRKAVAIKLNPELFLAEAEIKSSGIARRKAVREVVGQWAAADPEAAWSWLQKQGDVADNARLATVIADGLARKDAASAMQILSSLPRNKERLSVEGSIVSQWAKQDLEAAVRWALDEPNPSHRASLFAGVAGELAKSDPHRLMRILQELPNDVQSVQVRSGNYSLSNAVRSAVKRIAQDDPRQALIYLRLAGVSDGNDEIATDWVNSEPIQATAWADSLPVEEFRRALLNPMIETWAVSDPHAAAAFVTTGASGNYQNYLAREVTERWVKKDVGAALEWAASVSDSALRSAVGQAAGADPRTAASFVESLEAGTERTQAIDQLAGMWLQSDPQAAMEWLTLQMVQGEQKLERRLQLSTRAWVSEDPVAASDWLGAMPVGTSRDHATTGMLETLVDGSQSQRDYESAAIWAERIADEKLRHRWLDRIRDRLAKEMSEQATNW